ncbi:hypothetical protein GQ53DRAFT_524119 [Thozetella sp. PMI_491]|nr:hypothetical protein GQ53DRAFT_524119 [Thozetella sp. PMI_491]
MVGLLAAIRALGWDFLHTSHRSYGVQQGDIPRYEGGKKKEGGEGDSRVSSLTKPSGRGRVGKRRSGVYSIYHIELLLFRLRRSGIFFTFSFNNHRRRYFGRAGRIGRRCARKQREHDLTEPLYEYHVQYKITQERSETEACLVGQLKTRAASIFLIDNFY